MLLQGTRIILREFLDRNDLEWEIYLHEIYSPVASFIMGVCVPRPSVLIVGPSAPISSALGPEMEIKMIFANYIEKGLVDCESIEKFEQKLLQFYEYVLLDNDTRSFVQYKEDITKNHVLKETERACELSEDNDKFYNNSVEVINKLIKHWQNAKQVD